MSKRFLVPAGLLLALAVPCAAASGSGGGCSESFDAAGAPALPPGWHSSGTADAAAWRTLADGSDTPPNAVRLADHGARRYEAALLGPRFTVPAQGAILSFRQRRAYSWANTVGVLEIAIADGHFVDILAAGGEFLSGTYDGRSFASNPLGYRRGWLASSGGYTETRIRLPHAAAGKSVQLRFRAGSAGTGDDSPGWYLDSIVCSSP
ncbi:MAG TPA: hypothetical protein VFG55_06130 [Rhodanobacteraceae bacterium]|nr:hypothetical protein [Rhodanobacteraceae bacterium]